MNWNCPPVVLFKIVSIRNSIQTQFPSNCPRIIINNWQSTWNEVRKFKPNAHHVNPIVKWKHISFRPNLIWFHAGTDYHKNTATQNEKLFPYGAESERFFFSLSFDAIKLPLKLIPLFFCACVDVKWMSFNVWIKMQWCFQSPKWWFFSLSLFLCTVEKRLWCSHFLLFNQNAIVRK